MTIKFNNHKRSFETKMMSDVELFLANNESNFAIDFEEANEWVSTNNSDTASERTRWEDNHENVVETIKELACLYIDKNIG